MKKKKDKMASADLYNPTLTDVNRARERQEIIDPEKGPENKKRKNK
ncbi:hypothetical protein HNQ80_000333 [Anaerosolibacter carboniphilus]|uniref:Uncharacterized protein n=1 Tax=Anaerosolibacter carboniphilus TaxID=1417629 RepID=A0A841KK68_9FIRM|nr:hypothetical protein [Anaerosolibacter carboniphilus]MBB6214264.1 hypothetical protein [Anaerosolibacter carboniphilus]